MVGRRSVVRNVVVGIDGTPASLAALAWAAESVGPNGRIHAVVAVNPWTEYLVDVVTGDPLDYLDTIDSALVKDWTREARAAVGKLVTSVSPAAMAPGLDRAARDDHADAIVIGAHHAMGGLVKRIGRSTNQLLRLTRHTVVVVPGSTSPPLDGGNVVVGIGHGDATRSAVRWAAHLARDRDVKIELLHSTDDAPVFQAEGLLDLVRYEVGRSDQEVWEAGRVEHFAELMQTLTFRELDIAISTPPGLAAVRLDDASKRSALLVIGRHRSKLDRGHHTAQPLRYALTYAACPVAVVADHVADDLEIEFD